MVHSWIFLGSQTLFVLIVAIFLIVHVALRDAERPADRASHVTPQVTAPAPQGRIARGGSDLTLVLLVVEVLAGRESWVDEGPLRNDNKTHNNNTKRI